MKTTADSFENKAKHINKNAKKPWIYVFIFEYRTVKINAKRAKKTHNNSSLLFTLETTSTCTGWVAKIKAKIIGE